MTTQMSPEDQVGGLGVIKNAWNAISTQVKYFRNNHVIILKQIMLIKNPVYVEYKRFGSDLIHAWTLVDKLHTYIQQVSQDAAEHAKFKL